MKVFTQGTEGAMGVYINGMFMPCEDCALGEVKKTRVSKKAVSYSKVLGEMLFFDISSLLSPTFGGKNHCLLIKDRSDFAWSHFKKSESKHMMPLIKDLKALYSVNLKYARYNNSEENEDFERLQITWDGCLVQINHAQ